ncbi:hypothetical protein C1H46_040308 [Malus baccata]|uniref:DUF4408 domain-containing protein n=1 Tax=Malus baccata TaxID=106549 RepID=A0A540KJ06_MALBA|nr:hypothetical protein C1H46_040308 [Malus baccata]
MDDQNQQTLTNYYNSIDNQLLKNVAKFLLSASVFSFCFSRSSMLSFLHSFNFYFSTFPYQLFTHTIDKNFIFLICNLLFVFLAKHSGLTRSPAQSSYPSHEETSLKTREGGLEFGSPMLETEEPVSPKEDAKAGSMDSLENVAAEEHESEPLINQVEKHAEKEVIEDYEEQKEQEPESMLVVSEEEEEEEEDGKLAEEDEDGTGRFGNSTEELNKKFEDFIRRMKEELRIEAQRQLIMV